MTYYLKFTLKYFSKKEKTKMKQKKKMYQNLGNC